MNPTARAALYCRVSTDDQAEHGVSMADQERRLRDYCSAMGYEVSAVLVDAGVSGSTEPLSRPGLSRIAHLDLCSHLIAVDLSRFSRDTKHTLDLVSYCETNGIALVSLAESLDTKSPAGRLVVTVLAAMNQFQRENIAAKTKSALAHLKSKGRRYGGIPFGLRVTEAGALVVDEGEQKVLEFARAVFAMRDIAGVFSRNTISQAHNWAVADRIINPRTGLVVNRDCLKRLRDRVIEEEESGS